MRPSRISAPRLSIAPAPPPIPSDETQTVRGRFCTLRARRGRWHTGGRASRCTPALSCSGNRRSIPFARHRWHALPECDVEGGPFLILFIELVERGNLPAKGRSSVAAEDQHHGFAALERAKPHARAFVERLQIEIRSRISWAYVAAAGPARILSALRIPRLYKVGQAVPRNLQK